MGQMIETSRRSLLLGLGSIIAAPAIVRASNLMAVKRIDALNIYHGDGVMTSFEVRERELWMAARWQQISAKYALEIGDFSTRPGALNYLPDGPDLILIPRFEN
jgi:hypothetical protein